MNNSDFVEIWRGDARFKMLSQEALAFTHKAVGLVILSFAVNRFKRGTRLLVVFSRGGSTTM